MVTLLLHLLRLLPLLCGAHSHVALENLALRHQLAVYKQTVARPKVRPTLLGRAVESVAWLEAGSRHRVARHCPALAAASLPQLLGQALRPADRRTAAG